MLGDYGGFSGFVSEGLRYMERNVTKTKYTKPELNSQPYDDSTTTLNCYTTMACQYVPLTALGTVGMAVLCV